MPVHRDLAGLTAKPWRTKNKQICRRVDAKQKPDNITRLLRRLAADFYLV